MSIFFYKGNIFNSKADVIAHQVNCQGVMGGGIAAQIRNNYPMVFNSYKKLLETKGQDDCFGKCLLVKMNDVNIANLFGQKEFGSDKQYTDYDALRSSMNYLALQMRNRDLKSVAFPDMIGCGLAGGDREIVLEMIREIFRLFQIEIWKL